MDQHIKRLQLIVKCPFCGGRTTYCYDSSLADKYISWNFDCKPTCRNSIEMVDETPDHMIKTTTDLDGNFEED